jgi:hypothetical protein
MQMRLILCGKFGAIPTAMLLAASVVGCSREEQNVRVQTVPKQPEIVQRTVEPMAMQAQMPAAAAPQANSGGTVDWQIPDGWKELPGDGGMRFATIQVAPDNKDVVLTVIPLNGDSGGVAANVNRWRGQTGLPTVSDEEATRQVTKLDVSGQPSYMVALTGLDTAKPQLAMLAAAVPYQGQTWFFKLAGPAEIVNQQKAKFESFMKSVKFGGQGKAPVGDPTGQPQLPAGHPAIPGAAPEQPQMPAGHPPIPGAPGAGAMPPGAAMEQGPVPFKFQVPQGWTKDDPMPMRTISFHTGTPDKQVDVIVSQLPAIGGGGYLDNVNRWRGQVGLQPIKQGDPPQPSSPVKVGDADGTQFDFVGPGPAASAKRMIVAWVPRGNDWWFFKMTGTDQQVTQQQANFNAFLKSIQFTAPAVGAGAQARP